MPTALRGHGKHALPITLVCVPVLCGWIGSECEFLMVGCASHAHAKPYEKATRILQNVHRGMNKDGKLLVVESVIPPGNDPCLAKLLDLAMLVIPGGQERTEAEYRNLYGAAGFRLTRIIPTQAGVSVIEGSKE
jgi:hypothetical protein